MRYALWTVFFPAGSTEGHTPESIIKERGGWAEGAFDISDFTSVAYISDNADLTGLEDFQVEEITEQEALDYAYTIEIPNCVPYLDITGKIIFPLPSLLIP
jgi:hypothetical protein